MAMAMAMVAALVVVVAELAVVVVSPLSFPRRVGRVHLCSVWCGV
jgi:hypothetical protein